MKIIIFQLRALIGIPIATMVFPPVNSILVVSPSAELSIISEIFAEVRLASISLIPLAVISLSGWARIRLLSP